MLRDTGHRERYDEHVNKIPEFDPRSGNHYWIFITSYKVDPEIFGLDGPSLLDHENLVATVGPGCYYCEQPYTNYLSTRRCKGGS